MRDEMDARFWVNHHEALPNAINAAIGDLTKRLQSVQIGQGVGGQLIAILLSASFSLATIGGTLA